MCILLRCDVCRAGPGLDRVVRVGQDRAVNDVPQRICQGCGAAFGRTTWALDRDLRASPECWHAYGELAMFAVEHPQLAALNQLTVDAYNAQHAGSPTPPISVAYGLVGLQLALERGLDGETVQGIHSRMGKPQDWWPSFPPPAERAVLTIADVRRAGLETGSARRHEDAVRAWAESVWGSWSERQDDVRALAERLSPP
jgi:hypothetical protein